MVFFQNIFRKYTFLSVRYTKRNMRNISIINISYLFLDFHRVCNPNYISEDIKAQTRFHKKEQLITIVFVLFYKKITKHFAVFPVNIQHTQQKSLTQLRLTNLCMFFRRFFLEFKSFLFRMNVVLY